MPNFCTAIANTFRRIFGIVPPRVFTKAEVDALVKKAIEDTVDAVKPIVPTPSVDVKAQPTPPIAQPPTLLERLHERFPECNIKLILTSTKSPGFIQWTNIRGKTMSSPVNTGGFDAFTKNLCSPQRQ